MMILLRLFPCVLFVFLFYSPLKTDSITHEIIESGNVAVLLEHAKDKNTLVLVDLDLTVIKPKGPIGGGPLYDWICAKTAERDQIDQQQSMKKIDEISKVLTAKGECDLIDSRTPHIFTHLQNMRKIKLLACTARDPGVWYHTVRQLKEVGLTLGHHVKEHDGLVIDELHDGSPVTPAAILTDGVLFAGAQYDKGTIVKALANKVDFVFDKVILMDDRRSNIEAMRKACIDMNVSFVGILYTGAGDAAKITDEEAKDALHPIISTHPHLKKYSYLLHD